MSTVSPRRWVECGVLGVPTTVEGVCGWKEEGGWDVCWGAAATPGATEGTHGGCPCCPFWALAAHCGVA